MALAWGRVGKAVKALRRRIGSKNPKVAMLALTLAETLMKSCQFKVHSQIGTKPFLKEVAAIAEGKRVSVDVDARAHATADSRALPARVLPGRVRARCKLRHWS